MGSDDMFAYCQGCNVVVIFGWWLFGVDGWRMVAWRWVGYVIQSTKGETCTYTHTRQTEQQSLSLLFKMSTDKAKQEPAERRHHQRGDKVDQWANTGNYSTELSLSQSTRTEECIQNARVPHLVGESRILIAHSHSPSSSQCEKFICQYTARGWWMRFKHAHSNTQNAAAASRRAM